MGVFDIISTLLFLHVLFTTVAHYKDILNYNYGLHV